LRFGIAPANIHCIQFVPANPAGENLDTPAGRIELPSAAPENDWDRKRPLLFPYRKFHPVRSEGVSINLELFMSGPRKLGPKILVFRRIAGFDNVLTLRSEKLEESRRVIALRCIDGRLNGFLRGRKCPLGVLWRGLQ
jgi:hypothetical protein